MARQLLDINGAGITGYPDFDLIRCRPQSLDGFEQHIVSLAGNKPPDYQNSHFPVIGGGRDFGKVTDEVGPLGNLASGNIRQQLPVVLAIYYDRVGSRQGFSQHRWIGVGPQLIAVQSDGQRYIEEFLAVVADEKFVVAKDTMNHVDLSSRHLPGKLIA